MSEFTDYSITLAMRQIDHMNLSFNFAVRSIRANS
jgi:hypothetical protein